MRPRLADLPGAAATAERALHGVPASRLQLPPGPWDTVLECLVYRFPSVTRDAWVDRMARGRVLDANGGCFNPATPYQVGAEVIYWREVEIETQVEAQETVLHADAHLLVVDKPHGLPVVPAGRFVAETLLGRMIRRFDNPRIVPLHRIDRDTAGLVMFSVDPGSRARYHALFSELGRIDKRYQALAAPMPSLAFPHMHRSHIERGEPFFRMRETQGAPNSETAIDVLACTPCCWHYALSPITGRKHQLRVHMAALGAPIFGDHYYPEMRQRPDDSDPLQLLAASLAFVDPLDGSHRSYESRLSLRDPSSYS